MPTPYLFPEGARLEAGNAVLHAVSRRHAVNDYAGPLSIKTVVRGSVAWNVQGREFTLDPSSFLILADGERYSMSIDEREPVETCCVFFERGFVERVARDSTSPLESSLEDPFRDAPPLPFLSRLHSEAESGLIQHVHTLAPRCGGELRPSGFEEDFLLLAKRLLEMYEEISRQIARVPAARAATREELFRRVQAAREYLHAAEWRSVSLNEVSRAVAVSPYHLHRAFTRVFGETPHAYLTRIRLERARQLLLGGMSVTGASLEVGFESLSSFSRLFRARFGAAPSSVRRAPIFARSD
jgi:AraC-like DNA-binding protein